MSKKVSTSPYKGARDFYPEDKRLQEWLFDTWRQVVERYGYQAYDAPILEPTDLYLMKGSEEIVKEQTYTFKDRGDRSVTIRTEMTPSVSRMVAGQRQELVYPVRWYSIPNLWRYERMQRGRLREFWQLNVDIFGVSSYAAELEMIQIVDELFQAFKAKRSTYTIKLNSRLLVDYAFSQYLGLDGGKTEKLRRLVDRMQKMSKKAFQDDVTKVTKSKEVTSKVLELLEAKKLNELPKEVQQLESFQTLQTVMTVCKSQGIRNIEFDISLMRGFDYYTDIVFEAFDTGGENTRSILGGGRYDGLVGQFGVESVPTVGFAVGDVVFADFLRTYRLVPKLSSPVDVTLLIREADASGGASQVAQQLRDMGVNVAVDYSERKIDKQLKAAVKSGVRYALFVGNDELLTEKYTLKDLKSGKEQKQSVERIAKIIGA